MKQTKISFLVVSLLTLVMVPAKAQDAHEIVRLAEAKYNGETSNYSEMTMTIIRPSYQRSVEFKSWATKNGTSLTLITGPARDKGQSFLKDGNNLWSWNPTIQRLIKLPPSMMSQGWMGSDYTNDDILKESSFVNDYAQTLLGKETVNGKVCYKIKLTPLEKTAVVWGKLIMWISTDGHDELKIEFYDEDSYLVKTHTASTLKLFDKRLVPSRIEIIPADDPGNKTAIDIKDMKFNVTFQEHFFSQQNMKRVK
jgi:outer membrane lipoprotein-sorting protein